MTFTDFCRQYKTTREERLALLDYLAFLRFRVIVKWWGHETGRS